MADDKRRDGKAKTLESVPIIRYAPAIRRYYRRTEIVTLKRFSAVYFHREKSVVVQFIRIGGKERKSID